MANLVERLIGIDGYGEKIPVHQFMAAISELGRGHVTRAQIIAYFNLTLDEEADLDWLINKASGFNQLSREWFCRELHDIMLLAENGAKYTDRTSFVNRVQSSIERYNTAADA